MTMLAISQKPERVSNILRSSTLDDARAGAPGWTSARCSRTGSMAMAVMPLSFLVGCRR